MNTVVDFCESFQAWSEEMVGRIVKQDQRIDDQNQTIIGQAREIVDLDERVKLLETQNLEQDNTQNRANSA